jgi:hypothetical protein
MSFGKYLTGKSFDYEQVTPATDWTVDYTFSYIPIVEVMIDNPDTGHLEKIMPKTIERLNSHTVKISFTRAFSGKVHITG